MATAADGSFESWLEQKLLTLNPDVDTDVFVMYITGILDTEESIEDKKESLEDILGEVVEKDKEGLCSEILQKWGKYNDMENTGSGEGTEALASQLSEILEKQSIESVKTKEKVKAGSSASKAAILAQYGDVSDGEDKPALLSKNDNVESVKKREVEKRDKAKQEHEKKKEKDKQDRENQKQKQQERKDNEKKRTQKGERRR
ncbi:hypothetical protein FSP39_020568 [Pinctada imbricata]|uniref:Coiled-coil domain-containing protein 43 n=1 Tax=Pinctada imbricata TaxID=66713 RepID=A0AA89BRM3_PINIB|nr:hypothetical protein FSP39_020568 [Pinctada imbricata]